MLVVSLLSVVVVLASSGACAQTISLNPTYRSEWAVPEYFSSMGIEYLNHEVRLLRC